MQIGVVKWFNCKKGYGFIVPYNAYGSDDSNGNDVFAHYSIVQSRELWRHLAEGQVVYYELDPDVPDCRRVASRVVPCTWVEVQALLGGNS